MGYMEEAGLGGAWRYRWAGGWVGMRLWAGGGVCVYT